jgi:hypothetical protein
VRGIAPAKGDVAIGEGDQPGVGDGDAMSVGAEIAQHMFRAAEGRRGVDDPVMTEQHAQPCGKGAWLRKMQQAAAEMEFATMECVAQSGDELAAEDAAEHADGKEEGTPGGDPSCVVQSEAAAGNDAVDMRMKLQALIPAMQHAEETDLGTKMPRVASDLKQSVGTGVKEQVVDQPFVLQSERGQFLRQSEHGMDVASGQQFPFARPEPAPARVALASWAMPVSARNGELSITCLMGSNFLWRVTLPSEYVSLRRPCFEDEIHPRRRRGGGNVGIGLIDFQDSLLKVKHCC